MMDPTVSSKLAWAIQRVHYGAAKQIRQELLGVERRIGHSFAAARCGVCCARLACRLDQQVNLPQSRLDHRPQKLAIDGEARRLLCHEQQHGIEFRTLVQTPVANHAFNGAGMRNVEQRIFA